MRNFLLCALFSLFCSALFAQRDSNYVTTASATENLLTELYNSRIGAALPINNGKLYLGYPPNIEGNAYFRYDVFQKGSLIYDGVLYENVMMNYDVVKDLLVIKTNENSGFSISLFSPRIKAFSFSGLEFIYLDRDSENNSIATGFYLLLEKGKVTALSKTTKIINEEIVGMTVKRTFEEKTGYYILKDNRYYSIYDKKDLLAALQKHSAEIKGLLKKRHLKFKTDPQTTIASAVNLYNEKEN